MKRYPALLLVLALLFLCLFSGASADQEGDLAYGDLVYRLQPDGTVVITGCTGKNGDLSIPAKIAGAPVTAIAPEAFKSNSAATTRSFTAATCPLSTCRTASGSSAGIRLPPVKC